MRRQQNKRYRQTSQLKFSGSEQIRRMTEVTEYRYSENQGLSENATCSLFPILFYSSSLFVPVEDLNYFPSPQEELETATRRDGRVDEGG